MTFDTTITTSPQTIIFTAVTIGAIYSAANSITTIVTPVSGWATVTNPLPTEAGQNIQNDTAYRYTIKYSRYLNGRNSIESLYSALENFMAQDGSSKYDDAGISYPYIQGFYAYGNYTGSPVTPTGATVAIPNGAVYVSIYAPTYLATDAGQQYIAGLILNQISNQTCNIQTDSAYQYSVVYSNPNYTEVDPVTVYFDSPQPTQIFIAFTLTVYSANASPASLASSVQKAILSQFYFGYAGYSPENMNKTINISDYIATIVNTVGACTVTAQAVGITSTPTAQTLLLPITEVATLAINNINVTINIG